jgi:hypothetical protein
MVDEWETGERIPAAEQLQALARLTGFPINFFYLPPPPALGGVVALRRGRLRITGMTLERAVDN